MAVSKLRSSFGASVRDILRLARVAMGTRHIDAALEAPNQHYVDAPDSNLGSNPAAAYNWGIRQHWEDSVRSHHAIVTKALLSLRDRFQMPPERCLLFG